MIDQEMFARDFETEIPSHEDGYPLFAQPNKKGFFGLNELHDFLLATVDPYFRSTSHVMFTLDFSLIKIWDISAVLWLFVALHYYKRKGFRFKLRLPEPTTSMSIADQIDFGKSADFLRRWKFDEGLKNLDPDPTNLLLSAQQEYFCGGPRKYYLESTVTEESDTITKALISLRLSEIRNLTDIDELGSKKISDKQIVDCIRTFQAARIGDILNAQCNIEKRKADLFSDHLITEALVNTKEHPNATLGIMAIGVLGFTGQLILAIVDNGDPIQQTIYPTALKRNLVSIPSKEAYLPEYSQASLSPEQLSELTLIATQPGVSRKASLEDSIPIQGLDRRMEEIGMGLHYIKEDATITFDGSLTIMSAGVSVRLSNRKTGNSTKSYKFPWPGNLLRITIPLSR